MTDDKWGNASGWGTPPASDGWGQPAKSDPWGAKAPEPVSDPWGSPAASPTPVPAPEWGAPVLGDGWGSHTVIQNRADTDVYAATAKALFDKPRNELTENEHRAVKAANFGLLYGNVTVGDSWGSQQVKQFDFGPPRYFWHGDSGSGFIATSEEEIEQAVATDCVEIDAGEYQMRIERNAAYDEREREWITGRLDAAQTAAGVMNALSGKKDHWNVADDGELTRMTEVIPTITPGDTNGYYVAYHSGKVLHAILAGPYATIDAAKSVSPAAYERFVNDPAFKIAFENTFNQAGVYVAEIPMKAKRKGAYGVM